MGCPRAPRWAWSLCPEHGARTPAYALTGNGTPTSWSLRQRSRSEPRRPDPGQRLEGQLPKSDREVPPCPPSARCARIPALPEASAVLLVCKPCVREPGTRLPGTCGGQCIPRQPSARRGLVLPDGERRSGCKATLGRPARSETTIGTR